MASFPKTNSDFYNLFSNLKRLKDFCIDFGLLDSKSKCPGCGSEENKLVFYKEKIYYRCCLAKCVRRWSARNNVFNFYNKSNISYFKILEIFWYWSAGCTVKETVKNCNLQKKIIINWFEKIRNYCYFHLLNAPPMGGTEFNIQIDESLFRGRRKYNRGRYLKGDQKVKETISDKLKSIMENNKTNRNYGNKVTGPWVFGLVLQDKNQYKLVKEIELKNVKIRKNYIKNNLSNVDRLGCYSDKRKINNRENRIYCAIQKRKFTNTLVQKLEKVVKEVRMFYVPKRDAKHLMPIIQRNCVVGSEIVSDEWRAYRGLKHKG